MAAFKYITVHSYSYIAWVKQPCPVYKKNVLMRYMAILYLCKTSLWWHYQIL